MMPNSLANLLYALLPGLALMALRLPAPAQQPVAYRMVHEVISTEEGLPNRFINALHRTDQDLLFLAHSHGLHYYDGFQFHEVDLKGHYLEYGVLDILEDKKGRLWLMDRKMNPVGNQDFQILIFDPRSRSLISLKEACPGLDRQGLHQVTGLHQSPAGIQLIFDRKHHYLLSDTLRLIRRDEPAHWSWYDADTEVLWLKEKRQLIRIGALGERDSFALPPGVFSDLRIQEGHPQVVLVTANRATLLQLHPGTGTWQTVDQQFWHPDNPFPACHLDRTTRFGWRWHKELVTLTLHDHTGNPHFIQGEVAPGSMEWKGMAAPIHLDRMDEMWFMADRKLHHIFLRPHFFSEQYLQTDPPVSVRAIAMNRDSFLYLATYRGIYRLKPGKGGQPELFHPARTGYSLAPGRDGRLVMGTHTAEVRLIDPDKLEKVPTAIPAGGHPADKRIIYYDAVTDRYWCGTSQGLLMEDPGGLWKFIPLRPALDEGPHIRFIQRIDGTLWVGSDAGLYSVGPDLQARHYPGADSTLADLAILHMTVDEDHLYLATMKRGLVIVRKTDGQATFYTRKSHGLVSDVIYAALPDSYGWIWLPSERGLMRLDPGTSQLQVFDSGAGLPEQEFNTNAHFRDEEGYFYLGTLNGMIRFHPRDIPLNPYSGARLYFDAILINHQPWQEADKALLEENPVIQLPPGNMHWALQTHFSDLGGKHSLRIGYRLKDSGQPWSFSSSNILVLPVRFAGDYHFEIGVFPREGSMPFEVREITFIVPKPWRTILFWAIAVFLFSGVLVGGLLRRRTVLYQRRNRALKAALDLHTRDLQEKSLRLEDSNRIKDRMISILGHELRNPLLGFRQLSDKLTYLLRKDDRSRMLQVADAIEKQSADLLSRIDNLMEWARIQRGQMTLQLISIDLAEVIRDQIRDIQAQAAAKEVTIEYIPDGQAMIWADIHGLQFILINLLGNALKFSHRGSTITVRTNSRGDHQFLEVHDQGIGMDPARIKRLLGGDVTMPASGTEGEKGSGLGWTIIRELILRMGGSVTIDSSPQGTSIIVTFPQLHKIPDQKIPSSFS